MPTLYNSTSRFEWRLWEKCFFVLLRITKHTVSWNKYKTFFFICTFLIRLVDSVYFLSTQFARTGFTDIVMRGLGSLNSMGQGPQSAVPMYNTNTLLNQLLCYGGGARTPIVSAHTYKARSWLNIESTHTLLWPVAFLGGWSKDPNLSSTLLGGLDAGPPLALVCVSPALNLYLSICGENIV